MVRIITDSTCDLDPAYTRERDIQVLPLTVSFGQEHFRDGIDLSKETFYQRLEQGGTLPKTAQITPHEFEKVFRQAIAQGDQVVCVLISSNLSGTYQSALIGRNLVDGEGIFVIDSRTVTGGLGHLVKIAADLRDAGRSAAEITAVLQGLVPRLRFYAVLDTLKYLKLGGRISGAAAVVGGVLGIRPIISAVEGEIRSAGKVRSLDAGRQWLLGKLQEHPPAMEYGLCFTYSWNREPMEVLRSETLEQWPTEDLIECHIGSVVGTYAGPGAFGVMYVEK